MPDHSDAFLGNVHDIVNQAFEPVSQGEVPEQRVPAHWMAIWEHDNERRIDAWGKCSIRGSLHAPVPGAPAGIDYDARRTARIGGLRAPA